MFVSIRRLLTFMLDLPDRLYMVKETSYLTTSQGQAIGQAYKLSLGAAAVLLLCVVIPLYATAGTVRAQNQNGIFEPEPGAVISGVISIRGTARDDSFLRYELAFDNGSGWLAFAEGDQPVTDGTLAIWDTTVGQPQSPVFPDGVYQLRLRVVRSDYNYDEYFVRDLTIVNEATTTPTATATLTAEATTPLGTLTPGETATSGFTILQPTPLPSLTPFATPTLPGTPPEESTPVGLADPRSGSRPDDAGLLPRLFGMGVDRLDNAFWAGVGLALSAFALLALYLLLRALVRYVWRTYRARRYRN